MVLVQLGLYFTPFYLSLARFVFINQNHYDDHGAIGMFADCKNTVLISFLRNKDRLFMKFSTGFE